MNVRTIILSLSTGLVVIALFALFLKVRGDAAVEVPERALEEARQRHERAKASHARAAAMPATASRPARPAPAREVEAPAPEDLPDERPRPSLGMNRGDQPFTMNNAMQQGRALTERMNEVNKLYDRRDYEAAIAAAQEILKDTPRNVRMLRVVVSSACIMGEEGMAREHYALLPEQDQQHMSVRCRRFGMEFEPAADSR